MKKILLSLIVLFTLSFSDTNTQVKFDAMASSVVQSTTFSPQASSLFTFIGLAPASVQRPTLLRDLKFDGSLSGGGKISLGLELQPIWLIGFRSVSFRTYQKTPWLFRNLANTSISIGLKQDALNTIGYSVRIPLFYKDPMLDSKYIDKLSFHMSDAEEKLMIQIQDIDYQMYKPGLSANTRELLKSKRDALNNELEKDDGAIRASAMAFRDSWSASNWNSAQVSIVFAHAFDATLTEPLTITKQYMAGWLTANQPITHTGILSEMIKVYHETTTNSTNTYFEAGMNLTFGSPKVNFFVEGLVRSPVTNIALESFNFNFGIWAKPSDKISFDIGLRLGFDPKANLVRLGPAFNLGLKL